MSKAKRFSCIRCGTMFEVHPPDDNYLTASLEKPKEATESLTHPQEEWDNG